MRARLAASAAPAKRARFRPNTSARGPEGKMQSPKSLEFDAALLESFLRAHVKGVDGAYFHLERISGGQSNPTYFVTIGSRLLVMRKKPAGATLRSAHAIDR